MNAAAHDIKTALREALVAAARQRIGELTSEFVALHANTPETLSDAIALQLKKYHNHLEYDELLGYLAKQGEASDVDRAASGVSLHIDLQIPNSTVTRCIKRTCKPTSP